MGGWRGRLDRGLIGYHRHRLRADCISQLIVLNAFGLEVNQKAFNCFIKKTFEFGLSNLIGLKDFGRLRFESGSTRRLILSI